MVQERKPSFAFGPFLLDVSEQTLTRDGHPVPLAPKLFDVLRLLVHNHGHLVTKETFIAGAWDGGFVEEGALARCISLLRKALGDTLSDPVYIETVPKRGYRFVAPVTMRGVGDEPVVPTPARAAYSYWGAAAVVAIAVGLTAFMVRQPAASRSIGSPAPTHLQITFTGTAGAPAISQDGQRIAYIVADGPEKRAVVRDLAGNDAIEIFRAPELGYLRWSPDDRQLLVWARGGGKEGVYRVATDGRAQQVAPRRFVACWSPDGSLIAVPHFMGGEIVLRNLDGVQRGTLSLAGTHWSIWDLDWSRTTGVLAVVSNDYEGRYTVWTIQPDGGGQQKVIEEIGEITTVRWAPDGKSLYYSHRQHQTVALKSIAVPSSDAGLNPPATVLGGLEAGRALSISADGRRVLYTRAPFHSNLWLLALDRLNENGEPLARPLTSGTSYIERPRVSPDGTQVAFTVGHEPRTELYKIPLTGGEWTQLTSHASTNVGAAWSPDGAQIAFASTAGERPQIWTVDARGGLPRRRSTSVVSDSLDLSWSSAGITFQNPGNRNYTVLNPDTGVEHPLVDDDAGGWMSSPVTSEEGEVAVFWRRKRPGIYIIDPARQRSRLVYSTSAGSAYPIGWSASKDVVYVIEGEPAEFREMTSRHGETMKQASIVKVPVNGGGATVIARIPFEEIGAVAITPDGRRLVVPVFSSRSDIWLVEDFDTARGLKTPRYDR